MAESPSPEGKRRALGRGLEALIPSRQPPSADTRDETAPGGKPLDIPVSDIERNPFQTRVQFDDTALDELATSISFSGVIQPIVVRALGNGKYQLIAGERRWLASQRAGKETIPAIVREASDEQTMEMTVVENLQRADLNPMEQARAFERLSKDFKLTQDQMAQRTGKDRATVTNFLRLLKLPEPVQDKLESGELSPGHARALLALDSQRQMLSAAENMLSLSMSVRQAEQYVKKLIAPEGRVGPPKAIPKDVDPNVREAQDLLQRALGLRVLIEDKSGKGRVVIEYSSLEDFDTLLEILSGKNQSPAS